MLNEYKIVIYGKKIYREIELDSNMAFPYRIGTVKGCQVRLDRDSFFENVEFDVSCADGVWYLNCSSNVFFSPDGIMMLSSKALNHGDDYVMKYKSSNQEIFHLSFMINFDLREKSYDYVIDITGREEVGIGGGENCDIRLKDDLIEDDCISLTKTDGQYEIVDHNTKFGAYVNGIKAKSRTPIHDFDFFSVIGYSFYLKYDKLYVSRQIAENTDLPHHCVLPPQQSHLDYPKFNRSTRVKYELPCNEIEVLPPPQKPEKPKSNVAVSVVPILATLALTVLMRGMMGNNSSFLVFSVATMSIGAVMSVITYFSSRREYKKDLSKRQMQYQQYIGQKEQEIKALRESESKIMELKYPSLQAGIQEVQNFGKRLFEKNTSDDDFLSVRLGTGQVEASCQIKYTKQEFADTEDQLVSIPEKMEFKYRYLLNAPILSHLANANAIGIIGTDEQRYNLLKNMTLDLAVHHFYKDVQMFYLISEKDTSRFAWIRWLRNVSGSNSRNFMYDDESKNTVLEHLYSVLSAREGAEKDQKFSTYYVVFVFDSSDISKHPISKYIEKCSNYGFTFLFFEDFEELLPKGCAEIIRLNPNDHIGTILPSNNGNSTVSFAYEDIPNADAENVALKLSSIYVDDVSLESQLTKNISLFQLLHISSVEDLDIQSRWKNSEVYKSMAVPIGVKNKNEIIYLDINEKKDGPHGLVAGTTGSGKSELLQTYILAMATLFHPYEVSFVIIDFKGGGMVNQFRNLPHLIGSITNIDGREVNRSLLSIKSELNKRQEIFAAVGVNHIDAYIKKFKAGDCRIPIPHLILIVDEFAELKSEQPDFMKELISASRIGRSLGVHLILATQKPSGVVDDQIWSNSKFKLCLKVQTKQDSNEVIKSPLAAEIKEPGRAYLQVGNNEVFELFQSAYSGAPAKIDEGSDQKEFALYEVSLSGKRKPVYVQKRNKNSNGQTQLEATVEYMNQFCRKNHIEKLPGICLPPLPDMIRFSDTSTEEKQSANIQIAIGLYDDPAHQLQSNVVLNLTLEHVFIVGSSQYGKTNLLQTIIRALAEKYSPEEVNIYILDFASKILKNFEPLNQVGGVITPKDDERLINFFKMMNTEISVRKDVLAKLGISSFASYKEAGYTELPQIVIMLDNFTAFRELYQENEDDMMNICREGIAVGISLVAANQQTAGIGYRYLSNFSRRISFYCNDSGEYGNLFDRCRIQPKNVPGRALVEIDKSIFEFQAYLGFDGEKEIERVANMKQFISATNENCPSDRARPIPEIPNLLTKEYLGQTCQAADRKAYGVPVGLNYDTVAPVIFDLTKISILSVCGRERSGKTNLLRIIVQQIEINLQTAPTQVYLFDDIDQRLKDLQNKNFVSLYTTNSEDFVHFIPTFEDEIRTRFPVMMEQGEKGLENVPLLLIIVRNHDISEAVSSNRTAMDSLKKLVTKSRNLKICFLFSSFENEAISYDSPELLKLIKDSKSMLFFDDLSENKIYDFPMNLMRKFKKPIAKGDAYYICGSDVDKIKTVLSK